MFAVLVTIDYCYTDLAVRKSIPLAQHLLFMLFSHSLVSCDPSHYLLTTPSLPSTSSLPLSCAVIFLCYLKATKVKL